MGGASSWRCSLKRNYKGLRSGGVCGGAQEGKSHEAVCLLQRLVHSDPQGKTEAPLGK